MQSEIKTCFSCGKPVRGRSDKKFCGDYCRNQYNNQLKAPINNYVRNVNNILRRNRHILSGLIHPDTEMARTTKTKLIHQGFRFDYFTHQFINKRGNAYFFCYEYGYLPLDDDCLLVVRKKEGLEKNQL